MTDAVKGKPPEEAEEIFARFVGMVTTDIDTPVDPDAVGKLAVLAGVREFPMRIKCATLAWHTMKSALTGEADAVTTE